MRTLQETAELLRHLADQLLARHKEFVMPIAGITLPDAVAKLQHLDLASCNVTMQCWITGMQNSPCVEWNVWDGDEHYSSPQLAQAVNACLAAHVKLPPQTVEEVSELLQPTEF